MFQKLIPDSLSHLSLVFEVSSGVRCFGTTDSPLHSRKKILEILCLNTVVLLSYSLLYGTICPKEGGGIHLQSKYSVYFELVYREI